ncbi:hypothetical protein D3C80_769190 [compost metagenome]
MYLTAAKNIRLAEACSTPRRQFIHGRLALNSALGDTTSSNGRVQSTWKKKR